ncbi:MAG: hypothetical protein QOG97_1332, partial [Acidimicrobiaceae bacterium]|nr:hypothetical protein [Acidimicrobiaceae bacterium]
MTGAGDTSSTPGDSVPAERPAPVVPAAGPAA